MRRANCGSCPSSSRKVKVPWPESWAASSPQLWMSVGRRGNHCFPNTYCVLATGHTGHMPYLNTRQGKHHYPPSQFKNKDTDSGR